MAETYLNSPLREPRPTTEGKATGKKHWDSSVTVEAPRVLEEMTVWADCYECTKQAAALRRLWSQVQNRAHPTHFAWHCPKCNQDRQLIVD